MKIRLLDAMAAALLLLAPATGKGADASFAYQGCLLDASGAVLAERSHSITFRLYDQASGGTALWSCTRDVNLDEKGLFSVELSGNAASGESLGEVFAANAARTLFIGLSVGDDAEIEPRQRLLSVPQAFWAADSVGAQGDIAVSSNLVSAAADTGTTSAGSLALANEMRCEGPLIAGSLSIANTSVGGSISGNGAIPVGGILIWHDTTSIPDGWALCDGQNGTPDLRARFVVGAGGSYGVGAKGGSEEVTLTTDHLPSHSHTYTVFGGQKILAWKDVNDLYDRSGHYSKHANSPTTTSAGGGKAHSNMPPYYALCYIMRIK